MSNDLDNGQEHDQRGAAEDLSSTLGGGGETEFVVNSDEKKPMNQQLIYLLLLVLLGGGVTFYMYKRQGPATASAATPEAAKAKQTINSFLSQPDGIKAMKEMLKNTEKVVEKFNEYPSTKQVPLSDLQTNPFRSAKAPPKAPNANADAEAAKRKLEADRQAASKAFEALNLQTTILGAHKACMINNTLYREGQQVDQFTIESIEKNRVVVKSGQFQFTLTMRR
jgi:hypothetical protein